ncbi:MAG: hypothetical protein DRP84_07115 [Spirochaetes bacterium]|nr:MAG: hypothetical protein DRP84_07115 [Spirochaetota bacterium]
MQKKFLFISLPYERLKDLSLQSVPLGLLYLATVLSKYRYQAMVYDADGCFELGNISYNNFNRAYTHNKYIANLNNDTHSVWKELKAVLLDYKPNFVGIGVFTPAISSYNKVIRIVRETLPEAKIILGGPHITILKEKGIVGELHEAEAFFVGEAEETILEFANEYPKGNWKSIKGIIYKEDGKFIFTGTRGRIDNLDNLPIPERKLLYNWHRYRRSKLGLMVASRGCPFNYAFCASIPIWNKIVRFRSAENLIKEIDYLVDNFNIDAFGFWDDTYTIKRDNIINFYKLIYKKYGSRRFKWNCLTNVNCIDEELLYWLKKAGCIRIEIGVESGSERVLRLIKKNITKDQVRKVSKLIKERVFGYIHFL